jgi:ribosomal protein S9
VNVPGCGLFGFFYAVRTAIFRGVWAVAEDLHPFDFRSPGAADAKSEAPAKPEDPPK